MADNTVTRALPSDSIGPASTAFTQHVTESCSAQHLQQSIRRLIWLAGVGLMSFEPHARLPLAAFPLPALAPTDLDDADMRPPDVATPAGFRGCHYIMAVGKELWHKAYRSCFLFKRQQ